MPKNIKVARCATGACLQREVNPDGSVTLRSTTGIGGELTLTAEEWNVAVQQVAERPGEWAAETRAGRVTAGVAPLMSAV